MKVIKILLLISSILITLMLLTPNISSLEINPNGRDIIVYPHLNTNNDTIVFLNHVYEENIVLYREQELYNGTTFDKFEITNYINKTSMRFAIHNIFSFQEFNQSVSVVYPNGYNFTIYDDIISYTQEQFDIYVYLKINTEINFPFNSVINQTGIYSFNITTRVLNPSLELIYQYRNIILNVTSLIGEYTLPNEDADLIISYDAGFIGTLSGFVCLAILIATPMICAYKIKHTGEKLKWSVYGFILICIIFFCMIAFFQMG